MHTHMNKPTFPYYPPWQIILFLEVSLKYITDTCSRSFACAGRSFWR